MAGIDENGSKWLQIAENLEIAGNDWKWLDWLETAGHDWKWLEMAENCCK